MTATATATVSVSIPAPPAPPARFSCPVVFSVKPEHPGLSAREFATVEDALACIVECGVKFATLTAYADRPDADGTGEGDFVFAKYDRARGWGDWRCPHGNGSKVAA